MFYTVTTLGVNMSTEPELPRALALAWGVAAAPQRGPKREMSIERIVEAAMAIADESGLAAVSMSAVAARFDMTPMALYRYVSAKDDLVTLMFEYGTGLPPTIDSSAPWRESVELWGRAQLDRFLGHPWLLDIPIDGAPLTPNGLAWAEAGLTAIAGSGLKGGEQLSAILAVSGQMRWLAALLRTDRGDSVMEADQAELFRTLVTADAYPHYYEALFGSGPTSDEGALAIAAIIAGVAAIAGGGVAPASPVAPLPEALRKDKRVREAGQRRRERERELQHALRDEQRALRDARRDLSN
jgi:AcrR family transcriptional regulator